MTLITIKQFAKLHQVDKSAISHALATNRLKCKVKYDKKLIDDKSEYKPHTRGLKRKTSASVIFKEKLEPQRVFTLDVEKAKSAGETSTISYVDGFIALRGEKLYDLSVSEIELETAEFDRIFNWAVKFNLVIS